MLEFLIYLLVGTYTVGDSQGVYVYSFDTQSGDTEFVGGARVDNPSYLMPNGSGTFVYAVTENEEKPSYANSFAFDKATGSLQLLNSRETQGGAPCNIAVSPDNRFAVTANYAGGNLSVFPIKADGSLDKLAQQIPFQGKGPDPERQSGPHPHCVLFSPDGRYLFAADLGTDRLYRFDVGYEGNVFLRTESFRSFELTAGSGPRHFVFHPSGNYLYMLGELSGKVTVFTYKDGELDFRQSVTADPYHSRGSADIQITPDGRFLYASSRIRGDGLAIFSVHPTDGTLQMVGYQPTGRHPRNFVITPDGCFLLVANKDSDLVQVFRIDTTNGLLIDVYKDIILSMPVCLKFID